MLQNPNFPGLCPGPRWWSLQRSLSLTDPLADGEVLAAPPAIPPRSRPFRPPASSLRVSESNPLQSWQPY